jgi:hypothetical protein
MRLFSSPKNSTKWGPCVIHMQNSKIKSLLQMFDNKCTLRNPKRCAFLHKCVYSDNFDQPMSTTQNPNQHIYLCTSFKFYLDFQRRHEFFSKSVADLVHAQSFFSLFVTFFPNSIEQKQYLEKVTNSRRLASNLHNFFSTLSSCSQELGKWVTHTWKNFSHGKSKQLTKY